MAVETLLDGDAERLTQKAIALALEGDTPALKLCLERICPPSKGRPVKIDLPPVETASDLVQAPGAVVTAMAEGELVPDEAATVAGVLEAKRRAVETVDLERRIAALEAEKGGENG